MTELYIDGIPVVLPDNMDMKIKQQNPFFTKNGTFTFELTLSLVDPINAKLYKHINRLHASHSFDGRRAYLVADNYVMLNGTESIQKNTDKTVSIQLLSGNSELNYFIGSEVLISELNLGTEGALTSTYLNTLLNKKYPEAGFAPVRVYVNGNVYNWYGNETPSISVPYSFTNIAMQPYLVGLMEKTINALNYTIISNDLLSDESACRLFLLNESKSNLYNQMLPGWTAKEFLEACEVFFNITFDIDPFTRKVRIIQNKNQSTTFIEHIDNIFDTFERVFEKADKGTYDNVEYALPGDTWYQYQSVSDAIMEKANIIEFQTYSALETFLDTGGFPEIPESEALKYYHTLTVFYVIQLDTYFIVELLQFPNVPTKWYYLRPIDRFDRFSSEADDENRLQIEFYPAQIHHLFTTGGSTTYINAMPSRPEGMDEMTEDEMNDITSYIENGIPNKDSSRINVCLAFYTGSLNGYERSDYCLDIINEFPLSFGQFNSDKLFTLRINGANGMHERYYDDNRNYDLSKEHEIKFPFRKLLDVRSEFVINNKRFACKELEYRVTKNGIHPEVSGIFYPMKINS